MVVQIVELIFLYEDTPSQNENYFESCPQIDVERCVYRIIWMGWWICFSGSVFDKEYAGVVGWRSCSSSLIKKAPGSIDIVSGWSGGAGGWAAEEAAARGSVTRAQGISSSYYIFLYSLSILSFEASRCIARQLLYNLMTSIKHRCAYMSFMWWYVKNPSEMLWTISMKDMMASFFFSTMSRSPSSMIRDFSFSWYFPMICECFSVRYWKASIFFQQPAPI